MTTTTTQTLGPSTDAARNSGDLSESIGDRGLCDAAQNGEMGRITELLREGGFSQEQLASALFEAVSNNQEEVTIAIVQSSEFQNEVDAYKASQTAAAVLSHADWNHNETIMSVLLAEGVLDSNARDSRGLSLFMKAIRKNEFTIANAFMDTGVDVNIADPDGETPLYCTITRYLAGAEGSKELIEKLLKAGANLNFIKERGAGNNSIEEKDTVRAPGPHLGEAEDFVNYGYVMRYYRQEGPDKSPVEYFCDNASKEQFKELMPLFLKYGAVISETPDQRGGWSSTRLERE